MAEPRTDARAARDALDHLLETDAPALRAELPGGFADAAEAYVALLLDANARLNLTRVTEPPAVARLHLLDALAALPLLRHLPPGAHAVDIGSGGGVPGIVLALARPDLRWTLVESVGKKAHALRAFAATLELADVEVAAERVEVVARGPSREAADLVTARACAALPVLAEYALPLLRPDGRLLAWKGPISERELEQGAEASRLLAGGTPEVVPTGIAALGDHRFVVVRKEGSTPARYPRKAGEPHRRPLA